MISEGDAQAEKSPTFERIEEYKAILDNQSGSSNRRQNTNNIYVGLNTIFLTALGIFISTHLDLKTSAIVISVAIMTVPILVLNAIWLKTLHRYTQFSQVSYDYLREIEPEF
jgi:hypothetical protein